MRTWIRDQSLSLFFLGLFLLTLFGQSVAGWKAHNEEQLQHDSPAISYTRYLVSSDYGQAVMENWQSEYLQFVTFIMATVWLVQRGSNESKPIRIGDVGLDCDPARPGRLDRGDHAFGPPRLVAVVDSHPRPTTGQDAGDGSAYAP